jgi:hypothetical protein
MKTVSPVHGKNAVTILTGSRQGALIRKLTSGSYAERST